MQSYVLKHQFHGYLDPCHISTSAPCVTVCGSQFLLTMILIQSAFMKSGIVNQKHSRLSSLSEKYNAKDVIPCLLCEEETMLNKMRNHVGSHILHFMCNVEDPNNANYSPLERILVD